jgi:hypothetical protein
MRFLRWSNRVPIILHSGDSRGKPSGPSSHIGRPHRLSDGNVIRLNSLTGPELGRFLAEWRAPRQQEAKQPREPSMREASFSADGRTLVSSQMEWLYVWDVEAGAMRRKIRHSHSYGCTLTLAPLRRLAVARLLPRCAQRLAVLGLPGLAMDAD